MPRKVEPKQEYSSRIYDWQLNQIPSDNQIHDDLIFAFQQYYVAQLAWKQQGTKRAALDARYWLSEINRLGVAQRKFILEWQKTISDKSKKDRNYKPSNKRVKKKLLQIQRMVNPSDDNYPNE